MFKKLAASATNLKKAIKNPLTKSKSVTTKPSGESCETENKNCECLSSEKSISKTRGKSWLKALRKIKSEKSIKSVLSKSALKKKYVNKKKTSIESQTTVNAIVTSKKKFSLNKVVAIDLDDIGLDKFDLSDRGEILKLSEKINEVKQTVAIYIQKLQERGYKLEDLQVTSEKLTQSTQDLTAVSQNTKKKIFNKNSELKYKIALVAVSSVFFMFLTGNFFFA